MMKYFMKHFIMLVSLFFLVVGMARAESELLSIDWPADWSKQKAKGTMLSAKTTATTEKSQMYPQGLVDKANVVHLPVYMPVAYTHQADIQMVGEGDFYSITVPLSQATLFVSGDRTYQQTNTETGVSAKTKDINFVRAEGMVNVDFNRHGANYTLSIECDEPDKDKRCMQTDFLQKVYADLVMVGGKP